MRVLLLYLDAPLMSFGGTLVDQHGPTEPMPGRSMLAGLIGNALGWSHSDWQLLQDLQNRIRHSVRADRMGEILTDYQTVNLGQDFLRGTGWTTRGKREDRGSGAATTGTHIRYRQHWANAVRTVALSLEPADADPDLETIGAALRSPARPLFFGRKPCLPAHPLVEPPDPSSGQSPSLTETNDLRSALIEAPWRIERETELVTAWLPVDCGAAGDRPITIAVCDERDWRNQLPIGRRAWHQLSLPCPQPEEV